MQDTAILLPEEVPAAIGLHAALGIAAAAEEVVGTLVTSPLITSEGTSYGTGMYPGVWQGAGVQAEEDLGRFAKTIFTVVDTGHFRLTQGNARVM